MAPKQKKHTLDELVGLIRTNGSAVVKSLGRRLDAEDACLISLVLKDEGIDVAPYEFPTVNDIWNVPDENGVPLKCAATKKLIYTIGKNKGVDPTAFEGFKQILIQLSVRTFYNMQINNSGTTYRGLLHQAYAGSPSSAVIDLIQHDDTFQNLRDIQAYDFPRAPHGTWETKVIARFATKQLITTLGKTAGVDPTTYEGFKQLLPQLTQKTFNRTPINRWGTTLRGMLIRAYAGSPSGAVLDLIQHDDTFQDLRDIQAYDFSMAPLGTWGNKEIVLSATRQLIDTLGKTAGVDPTTYEGFKQLLPQLTQKAFHTTPINRWGTTLKGMITTIYSCSPSSAVLDLIQHDDTFQGLRDIQAYDFPKAPSGTWETKVIARFATKQLITTLGKTAGVDPTTYEGFKQLLPQLTTRTLTQIPIDRWGTTLGGMLATTYDNSPPDAIDDLLKHDPDFKNIRGRFPKDLLTGLSKTRVNRAEGLYSMYTIGNALDKEGLNLSDYGFYAFNHGEKSTVRELLSEEARNRFGDRSIAYFGLEGPTFGSYFALARLVKINPKKSLIPERNERSYKVMEQIKKMRSINKMLNGSRLSTIELVLDDAESALQKTSKSFDLIFLDWLGHIAPSSQRELELAYSRLNEGGMLAVTINTKGISEARFRQMTKESTTQDEYMKRWAGEKGLAIQDIDYVGGDKVRTPMKLYIMTKQNV